MSPSLAPSDDKTIYKLVFFVPPENTQACLMAIFSARGGIWPNPPLPTGQPDTSPPKYENCAFISKGTGQFRPSKHANPHIGKPGEREEVEEDRVETIIVGTLETVGRAVEALRKAHPYEVAAVFLESKPQDRTIRNID
ncbi:hypothetical protein H2200_002509 [Cladophialophora chaetospira]|uniref:ATP phosphoribosyltransferase n=1 Tax=Cladophialophora chaetospira TaxID=386627 RepID=A0AA38XJT9_9EURO|nr:hypothetical protein H2200_002509 [Cladophialophora chaetospira]